MLRRYPRRRAAGTVGLPEPCACDFFASHFHRHQSVTFSRTFSTLRGCCPRKEPIMIGLVRAAVVCATMALGLAAAGAADKAFKRDDLADSAVKLEAQIKSEAGPVAKSTATLRTDADTAFKRSDFRTGLQILGQIAATTPEDSANWLKLAKTIFQIRSASSSEQTFLLRARLDRGLHRLSARRQPGRGGGCAGRAGPGDVRPQALASGAGCVAAVARHARGRRGARPVREDARRARFSSAGLYRGLRRRVAAGLLPVLRRSGQAGRFRAVPGAGRHRQAGAVEPKASSSASTA